MKEKFIKVYSFDGVIQIVNLNSIALVNTQNKYPVLTLKISDKYGRNIEIIDSIKSFDYYSTLLLDNLPDN